MSFSDHKITAFTHKIADLPDQPNLPADELKGRFDSSPEELRQSLNSICDDADALTIRVDQHGTQLNQIAMDKFPDDTIKESNLHPELAAKINGMEDDIETLGAQKCEVYFGTYSGNGSGNSFVNVPQNTKAVVLHKLYSAETYIALESVDDGFVRLSNGVLNPSHSCVNEYNKTYSYICFCC